MIIEGMRIYVSLKKRKVGHFVYLVLL